MSKHIEMTVEVEGVACPICPDCGAILTLDKVTDVSLSTDGTKLFFYTDDDHQVSSGPEGCFVCCPSKLDNV